MKKLVLTKIIVGVILLIGVVLLTCGCESHAHNYSAWETIYEASCTEKGLKERTCSCGEVEQEEITATGHEEIVDPAVPATCTSAGFTAGKHCLVCNTIFVEQEIIDAKGHKEVLDPAVAPTCTSVGLTAGKHCSVCNVITLPQIEVPKLPHSEVVDSSVPATCTSVGLTAGRHCSVCSTITIQQTEVDMIAHTEVVDEAVAPTCAVAGLTEGKHCSQCDTILVQQETISKLGHTCQQGICERCEEYYDILDDIIILKPDGTKYKLGTRQFVGKSYRRNYYSFYCNVYFESATNWITINPDNTVTLTFEIDYCNGTSYSNMTYIGCSFELYDSEGKVIASCYQAHSCQTGDPTYTSGQKTIVLKPGEVYQINVGNFG